MVYFQHLQVQAVKSVLDKIFISHTATLRVITEMFAKVSSSCIAHHLPHLSVEMLLNQDFITYVAVPGRNHYSIAYFDRITAFEVL